MPAATFDGVNLNVNIPSTGGSVITMDAQEDFYEPWKDFLRQGATAGNMNNKRFPQTFRPIAGDDIIPAVFKYAGLFFLRNDLGWRFQLPDEDVTLVLTGNMALQDTSLPFFRARAGRTGAILGLASFVTGVESLDTKITTVDDLLTDIEAGYDHRDAMRLMLSVLAGKVSGAGTGTERFRDISDLKDRITATVDAQGNRTAVTRDET